MGARPSVEGEAVPLLDQIDADLKAAMRAGDERAKTVLRLVRAAIKNAAVPQWDTERGQAMAAAPIDDEAVLRIIAKEVKEHQDSLEEFRKANRHDLAAVAEEELAVLRRYLPPQLTREEIADEARTVIAETGARGLGDKGKVMPVMMARLRGRADGRLINDVVSELLAAAG